MPGPPGTGGAWDLVRLLTAGPGEPDRADHARSAAARLRLRLTTPPGQQPGDDARPGPPAGAAASAAAAAATPGTTAYRVIPAENPAHQRHVITLEPRPAATVRRPVPLLPPHTAVLTNNPAILAAQELPRYVRVTGLPPRPREVPGQPPPSDGTELERVIAAAVAADTTRHLRIVADLGQAGDDIGGVLRLHDMMFLAAQACRTTWWQVSSFIVILLGGMSPGGTPHPLTGLFTGAVKALDLDLPAVRAFVVAHDAGTLAGARPDVEAESAAERLLPAAYYAAGRRLVETVCPVPAVPAPLPLSADSVVVAAGGGHGAGAEMLRAVARAAAPRIYILGSTSLEGHPAEWLSLSRDELLARQKEYIRGRVGGPDPVLTAVARQEFTALLRARDVSQTVRDLSRACGPGRVSYLRCDVRDRGQVDAAARQVLAAESRIDLLVNAAAVNSPAALERKSLADFRRVRDLKVAAYLNLKSAFAACPPRRWVNTGSTLSLLGTPGEADYTAANDFLHTAAWHAVAQGGHELTIGFGHWAEAGLAATPAVQAMLERKYHLVGTSNDEGGNQFLTEVSQPGPADTAYGFGAGGLPFGRVRPGVGTQPGPVPAHVPVHPGDGAARPPGPFFADRVDRTVTTVTVHRDFDLDRDGYLGHHLVSGHPTLPAMVVLEMAAQAARILVPDRVPVAFEDVTFSRFTRVLRGRGRQRKSVLATLVTQDDVESVVHALLLEDLTAPDGTVLEAGREQARLVIRMSPRPPAAESRPPGAGGRPEPGGSRQVPNPYQVAGSPVELSGPFASADDFRVGPASVTAALRLDRPAIDRWFAGFTIPVVLLDALAQTAAMAPAGDEWLPRAVPRHVRRIRLYGCTDASLARQGTAVTLWSARPVLDDDRGEIRTTEALAVTGGGDVIARIEGSVAAVMDFVHVSDQRVVAPGALRPRRDQPEPRDPFRHFPEIEAFAARMSQAEAMIGADPYLVVHERAVSDTTVIGGTELIAYSSYNYLGLATHPAVTAAARAAIDRFGTSMSSSRIGGDRPIHLEFERQLAGFLGTESAIMFASGYLTNIGLIGTIVGPGDLVIHDAAGHRSIIEGGRVSGAAVRSFVHNDAAALDRFLAQHRSRYRRVLVAVEGGYSMDGDLADLPALAEVKRRHDAMLMVDEAHSVGVVGATGRGVAEHFGVPRDAAEFWTGTLSKAFASFGGYVAGTGLVIRYLRYAAGGFVFSAGLPPADAAAALAALQIMRAEPERARRLQRSARLFRDLARRAGLDTGLAGDSPVVPVFVRDEDRALRLALRLHERGINVNPVVYPGVARGEERLRFFVTATHSAEQIRHTIEVLAGEYVKSAT